MKLKTQFGFLAGSVTIFPIIFFLVFFGMQREPRDPRIPTRDFIAALSSQLQRGETLTVKTIKETAESVGMPLGDVALVASDGMVLASSFQNIPEGSYVQLSDFAGRPRLSKATDQNGKVTKNSSSSTSTGSGSTQPEPEMKIKSLSPPTDTASVGPFVLFDQRPFWSRQDIRNRNTLLVSTFALAILTIASVFSVIILRSLRKSIRLLEEDTAIVATGNLDHEVRGPDYDELQQLAKSINLMRLNLKDMLARRSKMLMGVSHDLKTPIALIQGYADALQDNVAEDKETSQKYIQIIQDKAKQLEDLTGDLIDFMKIGGDGSVAVEDVDLVALTASLGKRFQSDAQLLGRDLRWGFGEDYAASPPFPVTRMPMNRALVERAIENLVTNSLKYSDKQGQIGLRLLWLDGTYAFSVTDEGPGIVDSDKSYVFDAFYRGSHSRSDSGHGFGLTIVKAVADLHGWTATIEKRRDGKPGTEALLILKSKSQVAKASEQQKA
ncbi:MAG TPA: HAMP domain-containing sensor histidine kinase [Spirochaetales bacterium]|nr:HAMP domain-containing sensor histidine kinase [Spirochaetales bacterium]